MIGIREVAKLAKVSPATVSRVLNNNGYVSKEKRQQVLDIIKQLDYVPNELALNIIRKRTYMIGLIVPDITMPFYATLVKYIENNLSKIGYKLLLCNSNYDIEKEKEYIYILRKQMVDGIIIGSSALPTEEYQNISTPIVWFDRNIGDNRPIITVNHEQGGILAAEHLLECSCKNILQFCGSRFSNSPSRFRYKTFEQTVLHHQKQIHSVYVEPQYRNSINFIYNTLEQFAEIDGIFANEYICIVAMQYFYQKKNIPQEIQFVAYDGTYLSEISNPKLTHIAQPIQELANKAILTLENMIDTPDYHQEKIVLDISLVKGGSTM